MRKEPIEAQYSSDIKNLLTLLWQERIGGTFWHEAELCDRRETLIILPPVLTEAKTFWASVLKMLDEQEEAACFSTLRVLFPPSPVHDRQKHDRQKWNHWARELNALGVDICKAPCHPHQLISCSATGSHSSKGGRVFSYGLEDYACLAFAAGKTVFLPEPYCRDQADHQDQSTRPFAILKGAEAEARLARFLLEETHYFSPYTGQICGVEQIVSYLILLKKTWTENRAIAACWGMAWWKKRRIGEFFRHADGSIPVFCHSLSGAVAQAGKTGGAVAIWASYATPDVMQKVKEAGLRPVLVEDGFVRSLGLGSGFLPPSSIVADWRGLYVDARHQNDLEYLLACTKFDSGIRQRAREIIKRLVEGRISKYAVGQSGSALVDRDGTDHNAVGMVPPGASPVILVPGQVANDLSVRLGGGTIKTNLALLQEVRRRNPDAWIIYRPHPDVEAGHRPGALPEEIVLHYASALHRGGEMGILLEQVDEIHTLTSLAGFEGLLRGCKIVTYGAPFYAGWGLDEHYGPVLPRRRRTLSVEELVAGSLLLYPRYVDPSTGLPCQLEHLLDCLGNPALWKPNPIMRLRAFQGRLRRKIGRLLKGA